MLFKFCVDQDLNLCLHFLLLFSLELLKHKYFPILQFLSLCNLLSLWTKSMCVGGGRVFMCAYVFVYLYVYWNTWWHMEAWSLVVTNHMASLEPSWYHPNFIIFAWKTVLDTKLKRFLSESSLREYLSVFPEYYLIGFFWFIVSPCNCMWKKEIVHDI